ncbi:YhcH/YjgK/YiaL family protein [Shewanella intestini]|uniref:DUF386 domain-containing protein n=1 Tax=Shewanella intestini TaxID=2017544 RepID=A0ABS5I2Z6_9GAMM|nr:MULTISPECIES: YhcH/YjgK/YiaL family protein [Shewanella]MBR9728379.1 DUF386 domain-containing protein [Shewanella intestini]MRG36721.1 DUF386 family protein [Shewanella sp. XMDDZSB0408]
MIVDTLANASIYQSLSPRISQALAYLVATDFSQFDAGRHDVDGNNIFAIVDDYHTKVRQQEVFEAHQQYIDIQYVVSGEEQFGYLPLAGQTPIAPYHEKHDVIEFNYATNQTDATFVALKAGMFAIFYPNDIHMPGTSDTPIAVRKVVMKVKI